MGKYVNADQLVDYMRNEVHAGKAAQLIEKYAGEHQETVVGLGDPLPEGVVLEFYQRDDGSQWARLRAYADIVKKKGEKA